MVFPNIPILSTRVCYLLWQLTRYLFFEILSKVFETSFAIFKVAMRPELAEYTPRTLNRAITSTVADKSKVGSIGSLFAAHILASKQVSKIALHGLKEEA